VLRVFRGMRQTMFGSVGWFADRAVREDEKTSPTFVKWKPFPEARRQPGTASDTSGVDDAQQQ
jgi:hypothetical protein